MSSNSKTISKLEESLQNEFILTQSLDRTEIRDANSKTLRIFGYLGIALLLPIWTLMWIIDNLFFLIYCLNNGFDFNILSFTSFNSGTPYHIVGPITNRIKVEVCSNEHPPPHFHVFIDGTKHSFTIDDCTHFEGGKLKPNIKKKIKKWHSTNKQEIIEKWNETRISDCKVGKFEE